MLLFVKVSYLHLFSIVMLLKKRIVKFSSQSQSLHTWALLGRHATPSGASDANGATSTTVQGLPH